MPVGPKGQKRPKDTHANAVRVAKILTGDAEEEYVEPPKEERRRRESNPDRGIASPLP